MHCSLNVLVIRYVVIHRNVNALALASVDSKPD